MEIAFDTNCNFIIENKKTIAKMLAQITYDHFGVVLIAKFVSTLSICMTACNLDFSPLLINGCYRFTNYDSQFSKHKKNPSNNCQKGLALCTKACIVMSRRLRTLPDYPASRPFGQRLLLYQQQRLFLHLVVSGSFGQL